MKILGVVGRLGGFGCRFGKRKDLRHLLELDDYLLEDMGLCRSWLIAEWQIMATTRDFHPMRQRSRQHGDAPNPGRIPVIFW